MLSQTVFCVEELIAEFQVLMTIIMGYFMIFFSVISFLSLSMFFHHKSFVHFSTLPDIFLIQRNFAVSNLRNRKMLPMLFFS